ncbi:MAG TPA: zf-HC2 domain-containing protein [Ktedonobacterales bacterium]|nr:zf-HC2 domain-containing protein [Ktedonobacterales bacterium]
MTPDLSCERHQDSLPWYVTNSLSDGERAEMERHLASCERCRAALDEWRDVAAAMRRADENIPPDTASLTTWARIAHQLGAQAEPAYKSSKVNERNIMGLKDRIVRLVPNTRATTEAAEGARPRGPLRRAMDVVAVVAVIALSVGVFGFLAGRGGGSSRGKDAVAAQPACATSKATVSLPANASLLAIAAEGANDGWAAGTIWDDKSPTSPPAALLVHLRNCHWAPVGTPIPNVQLTDISMASPDDGWAVGATMKLDTTPMADGAPRNAWEPSQPFALHYTHGSWQQVNLPSYPGAKAMQVKMVSANEGWMLLYSGKRLITTNGDTSVGYGNALLHYQNGTWANFPMSFLKPSTGLADMDARQPGEVWLAGFDNTYSQPNIVAHYIGGKWTTYIGTAIAAGANIQTISEISPTDVWAAGSASSSGSSLYHFDGARWSAAKVQGVPKKEAAYFRPFINTIVMTSPTQGWAFGFYMSLKPTRTIRVALRYDHGAWQYTEPQIHGTTIYAPLSAFAQTTPSQGWALGDHLIDNGANAERVLLYYDAGVWGAVRQQS